LRECRVLIQRTKGLAPAHATRLDGFVAKLSEPAIVTQLVQSLDEVPALAGEATVAEVLQELRATALEPILTWLPALSSPGLRKMLEEVADHLAETHPDEVLRILRSAESEALAAVVALCGRLQLTQTVPGLGETVAHRDPAVRLAAVQALAQLGTPAALGFVEQRLEDEDRSVRLAAVRVVGARGYKGAQRRVEAVILGKSVGQMDLTEKMAFFEAYGAIAGASGLKPLSALLLSRGLLRRKESPETRACAAIALGRIRTPDAREVLQRAAEDKDLVVRNAVSRALRESST
jgi:HEAT repeat protein